MKSLSMTGGPVPRAKPGDYERALQLAATFGSKDAVTKGLKELRDAKAAADAALEDVEAAERRAAKRGEVAQAAETKATDLRQKLADETATAMAALTKRESAVMAREKAADARDTALFTQKRDIDRRVKLLREAGVVLAE